MKNLLFLLILFSAFSLKAQIHDGSIVFERRTNVKKVLGDNLPKQWKSHVKESKVDSFSLLFNDRVSLFSPLLSQEKDILEWAVNSNQIYENNVSKEKIALVNFYGEQYQLTNLQVVGEWKVTESKRVICNLTCVKAIWVQNDSTKYYAWFCPYITPSFGPEGISGLPGMILGLANADGSIVYFAKSLDLKAPIIDFQPKINAKKILTVMEFKSKIESNDNLSPLNFALYNDLIKWL